MGASPERGCGGFGRNHKVVLSQDVALGLLALGTSGDGVIHGVCTDAAVTPELLRLLVREHGLGVDARGFNKRTPLLALCFQNDAVSAELVGALVALGADVRATDKNGNSLLHVLCCNMRLLRRGRWLCIAAGRSVIVLPFCPESPFYTYHRAGSSAAPSLLSSTPPASSTVSAANEFASGASGSTDTARGCDGVGSVVRSRRRTHPST